MKAIMDFVIYVTFIVILYFIKVTRIKLKTIDESQAKRHNVRFYMHLLSSYIMRVDFFLFYATTLSPLPLVECTCTFFQLWNCLSSFIDCIYTVYRL